MKKNNTAVAPKEHAKEGKNDTAYGEEVAAVRDAINTACKRHRIRLVALSGGLDSSIIAWHARQAGSPDGVAVIADDFVSDDLAYCQIASREIGIPLAILNAKTGEILDAIAETIKILKNFNEIEIRNNVVMYLAAKWAADNGYSTIATGDGADELFAGYRFLINTPQDRLAGEIGRVCSTMHFPSQKICKALGVTAVSPFLDDNVKNIARDMDVMLKVRQDYPQGRNAGTLKIKGNGNAGSGKKHNADKKITYGKWILRKAFEGLIPRSIAWRPKAAMQDGAGTAGLTGLFDTIMRIDEKSYVRSILEIKKRDGVTIRNRESLHYYEIFKTEFGIPQEFQNSKSSSVPGCDTHAPDTDNSQGGYKVDAAYRDCPYCRCPVEQGARFCRMCAAFPI